jgi:hypothetical protein
MGSSSRKIESNVVGTEELRLTDDAENSRPAGLEKLVAAVFPVLGEVEGSLSVSARLDTSRDEKFGMGGIGEP